MTSQTDLLTTYFQTQIREMNIDLLQAYGADMQIKSQTTPDKLAKAQYAARAQAISVELIRRQKLARTVCGVCDTSLVAGGCPLCESKRAISLVQKRCVTCSDLFTHDELFDLIKCDSCTSKEIRRTSRLINHLGLRQAA